MISEFQAFIDSCVKSIQDAYESSPTIDEAEKLAAKFLDGQLRISSELKNVDLDSRMKKSGLKALKAQVYLEHATKTEKKPSDVLLAALVDSDTIVLETQQTFDKAEVARDELLNYLHVFKEAHLYFRNLAKGRFE